LTLFSAVYYELNFLGAGFAPPAIPASLARNSGSCAAPPPVDEVLAESTLVLFAELILSNSAVNYLPNGLSAS